MIETKRKRKRERIVKSISKMVSGMYIVVHDLKWYVYNVHDMI